MPARTIMGDGKEIRGKIIYSADISIDLFVGKRLRNV